MVGIFWRHVPTSLVSQKNRGGCWSHFSLIDSFQQSGFERSPFSTVGQFSATPAGQSGTLLGAEL